MQKTVDFALVGAGHRGLFSYGGWIDDHPDRARVTAVAEPRPWFRGEAARRFQIPTDRVFGDWRDLLARPRLADAVLVATTDQLHLEPTLAAAEKGYHILLEKPMAPAPDQCARIVRSARQAGVILAVCHVLRYAPFYRTIKQLLDDGAIGDLQGIQHMEGVAWWHFAHSYVRGNGRREDENSSMLLAKSCHDLDILRWWVGRPCRQVASFGQLRHFRPEMRPAEAADRCLDCPLAEGVCPYSAKHFYFGKLLAGEHGWPLSMVVQEYTAEALEAALRHGPYGRCVYACDNDVVDHQAVIMDFEGDITADFTLSAFTPHGRKVRLMGSEGYIEGEKDSLRLLRFATGAWEDVDISHGDSDLNRGHGGGDQRLMDAFCQAVSANDEQFITTGPEVSLDSHMIVFAAEIARRERRSVCLEEVYS